MPDEAMDPAARDEVFAALLKQHPDAFVGAVSPMGLAVPLPDGLDIGGLRPIVGAQSALALVVTEDQKITVDAWQRALGQGLANCLIHPVAAPTELVRLHLVDMTHRYGVFLMF